MSDEFKLDESVFIKELIKLNDLLGNAVQIDKFLDALNNPELSHAERGGILGDTGWAVLTQIPPFEQMELLRTFVNYGLELAGIEKEVPNPLGGLGWAMGVPWDVVEERLADILKKMDEAQPSPSPYQPLENPNRQGLQPALPVDPVVLKLTHDIPARQTWAYFDHNGDGFAEASEWIRKGEALLVMDRDGNGQIDDGSELFGDYTKLARGSRAKDGMDALRAEDTNRDGILDKRDASWGSLLAWEDNGNGIVEEGELKTLEALGIAELSLTEDSRIYDAMFSVNRIDTVHKAAIKGDKSILKEAFLPGSGTLLSSWEALAGEEGESLRELLHAYEAVSDESARSELLDSILYHLAGATEEDADARGNAIDGRKLKVLEAYYGDSYKNGANPNNWNGSIYTALYGDVKQHYEGWLAVHGSAKPFVEKITPYFDEKNVALRADFSAAIEALEVAIAKAPSKGAHILSDFAKAAAVLGWSGFEDYQNVVSHFAQEDDSFALAFLQADRRMINGTKRRDERANEGGNALLLGKDGDDSLYAHGEDTVIVGGSGNDKIYGNRGDDPHRWGEHAGQGNVTIFWGKNDGKDTVHLVSNRERAIAQQDTRGQAFLLAGEGIHRETVGFYQEKEMLTITNKETGASISLPDWFRSDMDKLDGIIFADGTRIDKEELWREADGFHNPTASVSQIESCVAKIKEAALEFYTPVSSIDKSTEFQGKNHLIVAPATN